MAINAKTHNPFDPAVTPPSDAKPEPAHFVSPPAAADYRGMIAAASVGWEAGIAALNEGVLKRYPQPTEPTVIPGQPTSTPTPEALIPSTRQTISTGKGSVEVGKLNDGKEEFWVAMAPTEDGSGFKTYKLDIDPKKYELSETDKEKIQRMIDYGYFGKLKPEAKPSSTPVVHKEGEPFDSRPYKGFGRTFQVLNKGVYELWYDPNGAGENQLVWTSKRPLDLSKDLKPRTPLANKLEQIAERHRAPVLLFPRSSR